MHQLTDFNQPGVMWFDQQVLEFLQNGFANLADGLAGHFGNKVIVSGMQTVNGTISAGWVSLNGELLPFTTGSLSNPAQHVDVSITTADVQYDDGTRKPVQVMKVLKLVALNTSTSFPFSDLVRPGTFVDVWKTGDIKHVTCTAQYIIANFDLVTGEGLFNGERAGWKIKFSAGGRVLVGYTPVAVDPNDNVWDAAYTVPGSLGGEKLHQLITQELPRIRLKYTRSKTNQVGPMIETNSMKNGNDRGLYAEEQWTDYVGGDQAHENRMPFEVVLIIEKM